MHDPPASNDNHPPAERRDVLHVVAGQQDRDPPLLLIEPQERLDVVLGDHVEANRRLVEEQHFGECSSAAINSIFIRSPSDNSRTGCRSSVPTFSKSTNSSASRSKAAGSIR